MHQHIPLQRQQRSQKNVGQRPQQRPERKTDQHSYRGLSVLYTFSFALTLGVLTYAIAQSNIILMAIMIVLSSSVSFFAVRQISGRLLYVPLAVLFTISAALLFYFVDPLALQYVFIGVSIAVYFAMLRGIVRMRAIAQDPTARGLYIATMMIVMFFAFASFYGFFINFRQIVAPFGIPLTITLSPWILMVLFFAVTWSMSYAYFYILSGDKRHSILYGSIIGLAMAQFAWAASFWPFRYLTTAVVALMFYYVLFDLGQSTFLHALSKRRVVTNIIFFVIVTSVLLISAQWRIIV